MRKALGIAALVVAIVSIFVPLVGPWLTVVSAILAASAFGPGVTAAVAAIVVNLVNLLVMSPSVWLAIGAGAMAASKGRSVVSIGSILFGAQLLAAAVLLVLHRRAGGRRDAA